MADPFVGKLAFFRVYSGSMAAGSYVLNATKDKKERVGRILQMHANKRQELDRVYSGDIAAAVGFKFTTTGDTICDEQHPVILESMEFPEPVIELAIEPKTKAGQGKMGEVVNILEPFKRLTIFEPVEKDGETTEKKVTVGIIYRSDGLYAWDNSRAIPNEYDEAIKWSPASQLPEYAIRRKAIVTKFEYKPLRSFTADDIKLLRLDYASQDDPQLLMEEYLPIKNFELLYGWWKQHYKATLKDCDNPQAIILHLASTD